MTVNRTLPQKMGSVRIGDNASRIQVKPDLSPSATVTNAVWRMIAMEKPALSYWRDPFEIILDVANAALAA